VVHGGLFSRDGVTLDDIRAINRNMCVCHSAVVPTFDDRALCQHLHDCCALQQGRLHKPMQVCACTIVTSTEV
jgi:hypothetical protein